MGKSIQPQAPNKKNPTTAPGNKTNQLRGPVCIQDASLNFMLFFLVDCAPGEYWEAAADPYDWGFCYLAPEGFFSPNPKTVGMDGLTECPDGKTTEERGAASVDLCKGTAVHFIAK